jgi:hypothetical protein
MIVDPNNHSADSRYPKELLLQAANLDIDLEIDFSENNALQRRYLRYAVGLPEVFLEKWPMSVQKIVIGFVDCSSADANRYAQDLEGALIRLDPSIDVKRGTKEGSQDIVSSLVLLFGTPVTGALAHAVYKFVARNTGAKIRISTPDGWVIAENLDSKDAARIAEAFASADKAK